MKDAVIVSAVRTAVGKAGKGTLRAARPDDLAAIVIAEAIRRVPGLDAKDVEDVVIGCAIEIHRALGPGLLESTYDRCLAYELASRGIHLAQVITYAKLLKVNHALLINFNVTRLIDGLRSVLL